MHFRLNFICIYHEQFRLEPWTSRKGHLEHVQLAATSRMGGHRYIFSGVSFGAINNVNISQACG